MLMLVFPTSVRYKKGVLHGVFVGISEWISSGFVFVQVEEKEGQRLSVDDWKKGRIAPLHVWCSIAPRNNFHPFSSIFS